MADDADEEISIEEYYCRGCGWTKPIFQPGDPAVCSNCGVEYEPDPLDEAFAMKKRVRTWPRCSGWNKDGSKCDIRTEREYCHHHRPVATDGGRDLSETVHLVCAHCGHKARTTIDAEHIHKCSDVVTKHELWKFIEQLQEDHEHLESSDESFYAGAIGMQYSIIYRLEELITGDPEQRILKDARAQPSESDAR